MKNMLRFFRFLPIFFAAIAVSVPAFGLEQSTQSYTDLNIVGNFKANERLKWLLYTEGVWNIDNPNNNQFFDQAIFRGGLGYQLTPDLTFWGAYSFVTNNPEGENTYENRVHEQLTWVMGQLSDVTFISNSRVEQRFYSESSEVGYRYRQTLQAVLPPMTEYQLVPVIYDEVYINLNNPDWVGSSTLSENDIFVGVEIPTSKDTAFTVGYTNQYLFNAGGEDGMNHVVYFIFDIGGLSI